MYFLSFIVRLKFQKRNELKFVSRTIPQSGGHETLKLALGFHACDCLDKTLRKKFPIFLQLYLFISRRNVYIMNIKQYYDKLSSVQAEN